MASSNSNDQDKAILNLVEHAMGTMRGDRPFSPNDPELGLLSFQEPRYKQHGAIYHYTNKDVPPAGLTITTTDDPLAHPDDRDNVQIVPLYFQIRFYTPINKINPAYFKNKLRLCDYWVGSNGKKYNDNDLGAGFTPNTLEHRYRYRAEETGNKDFPVDVELFYLDASKDAQSGLWRIDIRRAYPYRLSEERKQNREHDR